MVEEKEKRICVPYEPGDEIDKAVLGARDVVKKHIGKVTKAKALQLLIWYGLPGLVGQLESLSLFEKMDSEAKVHNLKTWPEHFSDIFLKRKTFEARLNDRNFQVGDLLILEEWDPESESYTSRRLTRKVTHILPGGQFGINPGTVVMSIQ